MLLENDANFGLLVHVTVMSCVCLKCLFSDAPVRSMLVYAGVCCSGLPGY